MALKQHAKGFTDDLNKLTEQQLRSFLEEELDSEDVNVELIKNITDVLAAKTNAKPIDAETAYRQFMSQYADTAPLYKDMEQELGGLETDDAAPEIEADESLDQPKKVIRFSRLAKFGILVAAIVSLLFAVSAVASAMGFNIWRAIVTWDQDNMGVSTAEGKPAEIKEDPYSGIRTATQNEDIQVDVIPSYLPEGYSLADLRFSDTYEGHVYKTVFRAGDYTFCFTMIIHPVSMNTFYPKDVLEPEIYPSNGIEHYITLNEGSYRAVWANGDVVCELYGLESKEELLRIIDSIYKE